MKFDKHHLWSLVGLAAVVLSGWLLFEQLDELSLADVLAALGALGTRDWLLCTLSAFAAYAALAGYDRVALLQLQRRVPWAFIAAASFTAYAIGHNLGASVVSGGLVRYRAYRSKGLTPAEIALLIGFCSFTFGLAVISLGGLVLLIEPGLPQRFLPAAPRWLGPLVGAALLGLIALYLLGSHLRLQVVRIRRHVLRLPTPAVAWRQVLIAPLETAAAAAIIYFALPDAGNPGFVIVLGVFLASFSAALLSHAPGGLGVLELVFLLGLPEIRPADLIAALLVFRLLYLLLPFAVSILLVAWFEHGQWMQRWTSRRAESK